MRGRNILGSLLPLIKYQVKSAGECAYSGKDPVRMSGGNALLLLLLIALLSGPVAEGFCPYGCGCDETNSRVTCIKTDLEVSEAPFLKGQSNPIEQLSLKEIFL